MKHPPETVFFYVGDETKNIWNQAIVVFNING